MTLQLVGASAGGVAVVWGVLLAAALARVQRELRDVERRVRWMETHPPSQGAGTALE